MGEATCSAAEQFAGALTSGMTGRRLYATLVDRFPKISRFDAFQGIAIALSLWEADMVAAECELQAATARPADG